MTSLGSCLGRMMVVLTASLVSTSFSSSRWGEEGVEYRQLGTSITLPCERANGSSLVEWRFNGAPHIPQSSYTQLANLTLLNVDLSAVGNYSCHDDSGRLLSAVFLRLGHRPGKPSVSCRVSNYENFSCSWTSSLETFLPTRYTASYRDKHFNTRPCLQDPAQPNVCSVVKEGFWSSYRLNVTEENPLGSNFRLLDVLMQAMVKPDPPESLLVEPVPFYPRRLQVSWDYPVTWPRESPLQLKFRLQYRTVLHGSWTVVETENLSVLITDALSGTEHVVQVSAKDYFDAGNWSDWSVEGRATPWKSPTAEASDETTAAELESSNEGPSQVPHTEPFDRSDPLEKVAILASMGTFAFIVLTVALIITILIWVRVRRKGKEQMKNHNFISGVHMKALPKAQIL
ncbi:interleukin-11 receptor subunit alpha isoform X2 [Rhinatrema bivittatum]|uniref:interleukin-11 receptor subunit alpha isoform X2 n=2 Tax=Rhinatrema bivittatum TaxID=194408 RepID=UPI001129B6A3|nr:interleukin-11 receptor subunit alpha isoform X2 [Rhinatrema bivittatum]